MSKPKYIVSNRTNQDLWTFPKEDRARARAFLAFVVDDFVANNQTGEGVRYIYATNFIVCEYDETDKLISKWNGASFITGLPNGNLPILDVEASPFTNAQAVTES